MRLVSLTFGSPLSTRETTDLETPAAAATSRIVDELTACRAITGDAERLAWLTGFTGSFGFVAVLPDIASIFVDGRYTLQVREQVAADVFALILELRPHAIVTDGTDRLREGASVRVTSGWSSPEAKASPAAGDSAEAKPPEEAKPAEPPQLVEPKPDETREEPKPPVAEAPSR